MTEHNFDKHYLCEDFINNMSEAIRDYYYTITEPIECEQNIQRSRFIGYVAPISSSEEALEFVSLLRTKHHSATHVCWAYSVYEDDEIQVRSNDDGEPSGTAGKPILGRITAADLTQIVVAVVRYFGGVKLGTSGLIDAYRSTTEMLLDGCTRQEVVIYDSMTLSFDMNLTGVVMQLVKRVGASIVAQDYSDKYHLTVQIRRSEAQALRTEAEQIYGVNISSD